MAKKTNDEMVMSIDLPKIETGLLTLNIIGDSPLIVHRWSEKAKKEMLDKQMKNYDACGIEVIKVNQVVSNLV